MGAILETTEYLSNSGSIANLVKVLILVAIGFALFDGRKFIQELWRRSMEGKDK